MAPSKVAAWGAFGRGFQITFGRSKKILNAVITSGLIDRFKTVLRITRPQPAAPGTTRPRRSAPTRHHPPPRVSSPTESTFSDTPATSSPPRSYVQYISHPSTRTPSRSSRTPQPPSRAHPAPRNTPPHPPAAPAPHPTNPTSPSPCGPRGTPARLERRPSEPWPAAPARPLIAALGRARPAPPSPSPRTRRVSHLFRRRGYRRGPARRTWRASTPPARQSPVNKTQGR